MWHSAVSVFPAPLAMDNNAGCQPRNLEGSHLAAIEHPTEVMERQANDKTIKLP
jgi:hypothetical protein